MGAVGSGYGVVEDCVLPEGSHWCGLGGFPWVLCCGGESINLGWMEWTAEDPLGGVCSWGSVTGVVLALGFQVSH